MSNTELLEELGKLRRQVAQMTPGPWPVRKIPVTYLVDEEDGGSFEVGSPSGPFWVAHTLKPEDADGIAALRNVADELLAAAEALVVIQQQASRQLAEPPHDDQAMLTIIATFADAALDALAKKLEAAS